MKVKCQRSYLLLGSATDRNRCAMHKTKSIRMIPVDSFSLPVEGYTSAALCRLT